MRMVARTPTPTLRDRRGGSSIEAHGSYASGVIVERRFRCSLSPRCHLPDDVSNTKRNFCVAAAVWVSVVRVVIHRRQSTQLETVEHLSACFFYRTSRRQSNVCRSVDLFL